MIPGAKWHIRRQWAPPSPALIKSPEHRAVITLVRIWGGRCDHRQEPAVTIARMTWDSALATLHNTANRLRVTEAHSQKLGDFKMGIKCKRYFQSLTHPDEMNKTTSDIAMQPPEITTSLTLIWNSFKWLFHWNNVPMWTAYFTGVIDESEGSSFKFLHR